MSVLLGFAAVALLAWSVRLLRGEMSKAGSCYAEEEPERIDFD